METATGNEINLQHIEECIIRNAKPQYMPIANIIRLLEERQVMAVKYLNCPDSKKDAKELYGKYIDQVNKMIMEILSIPISQ